MTQRPRLTQICLAFSQGEREKPVLCVHPAASLNQLGFQASLTCHSPLGGVNKAIIWQFGATQQAQGAKSFKYLALVAKARGGDECYLPNASCCSPRQGENGCFQHLKLKCNTRPCSSRSPYSLLRLPPHSVQKPVVAPVPIPTLKIPASSSPSFPCGTQNPASLRGSSRTRKEPSLGPGKGRGEATSCKVG